MTDALVLTTNCGLARPKLACGHFGGAQHPGSSTWDFPMDEVFCYSCKDYRYLDIMLQQRLLNKESIPTAREDDVR